MSGILVGAVVWGIFQGWFNRTELGAGTNQIPEAWGTAAMFLFAVLLGAVFGEDAFAFGCFLAVLFWVVYQWRSTPPDGTPNRFRGVRAAIAPFLFLWIGGEFHSEGAIAGLVAGGIVWAIFQGWLKQMIFAVVCFYAIGLTIMGIGYGVRVAYESILDGNQTVEIRATDPEDKTAATVFVQLMSEDPYIQVRGLNSISELSTAENGVLAVYLEEELEHQYRISEDALREEARLPSPPVWAREDLVEELENIQVYAIQRMKVLSNALVRTGSKDVIVILSRYVDEPALSESFTRLIRDCENSRQPDLPGGLRGYAH